MNRTSGRSFARKARLGILAAIVFGCAGALPEPQAADATWATARWPDMSIERLRAGRELYAQKCSSCHALKAPDAVAPDAWASEVADMRAKRGSQLTDEEAELIVRYLVTESRHGHPPSARNTGAATEN